MTLSQTDRKDLERARMLLENPGLPARLANLLGSPIEQGMQRLPKGFVDTVAAVTRTSLNAALDVAVHTLERKGNNPSRDVLHRVLVAGSGALGGAFGLGVLAVELPISTTLMLRSIADIARSEGESLEDLETRLACLEVFALGSGAKADTASETGYFAVRGILARAVGQAAEFIAERGLVEKGAPALVRLIASIATRFSTVVTEKAAAQAIPLIGAAGGALVNTVFIGHFQDVARGHFIIRRLERLHGSDTIRQAYARLGRNAEPAAAQGDPSSGPSSEGNGTGRT